MIVFVSAAATERQMVAAASKSLPVGFPTVRALEWLPGKGIGLSESCYPELAIGDLPVFYPFIISDPGEGTQTKRRMHACIIDHLIPPMTQSETYDELARLQQLLGAYANAGGFNSRSAPSNSTARSKPTWERTTPCR